MDTYTPDQREEDWDAYRDGPETEPSLPRRARRKFFNRRTAALAALVTCAIGFYAGIRVEKSQLPSSSSGLTAGSGAGARAGARTGGFAALLAGRGGASGAAAAQRPAAPAARAAPAE